MVFNVCFSVQCDDCRNILDEGNNVYCQRCFSSIGEAYRTLESEVEELKDTIKDLKKELEEMIK